MPKVKTGPGMIPTLTLDQYKGKFKDIFMLERSPSGVLMAKWHTKGDSLLWSFFAHRALHQLFTDVGQDVENEVFILTGTGHNWIADMDTGIKETEENKKWLVYEHHYYDGTNLQEGLVFDLEIPTIGAINGPGFHTEMALFCDITIMSEDAVLIDPHYLFGMVPGDGVQIAFRECMGIKRANYAMLMGEKIDAEKALRYGMVNEVVPKAKIYQRAWEIGEQLAKSDRTMRRLTIQVLRAPWKVALASELRHAFGTEMMAYMAGAYTHDIPELPGIMESMGAKPAWSKKGPKK
jgi:enoyl-CoA hydratase/carnithine racemase